MELNETVVSQETEPVADDALPEGLVEEVEDETQSIDEFLDGETEEEQQPAEEPKAETQGSSEPGWIKKRVDKAVQRAVAETESRMRAEFERQMAPIRARMVEDEANELVRSGKVKDLETALELVRYRQGQEQPSEQPQQSRNDKGQFTSKDDPAVSARINMLSHQADRIRERSGVDVIAEFNKNPDIKQKVISGEMDFYDVAEAMRKPKKKAPSPMRSPNGANGYQQNAIDSMSDEQFAKLEKRLREGARITQR